ncbi:ABC transporter ATP-binding protein [Galbitalea sp. SE-J8]|uniref:ABC transporter ATP-binding protein n=1 Tax=Galbitalea sp. SE-J8 TaxID=3054952 RepID=UPI00259C6955|nr:ABC transporter ATP-binding protein [Galbitalea sp. SE-J8]MDM4761609.1 ABC transporter ATP-binding protein [Galbitalea sp. SE-J8]
MTLEIENLRIDIRGRRVVDGVSVRVDDGERVGLIGESGSGKSLTALAVLGLLPPVAAVTGRIRLDGRDLLGLSDRELARVRGKQVGMVFQEPRAALNPTRRVGAQIAEALRIHYEISTADALARAVRLVERVRLPDPEGIVQRYPHQLSGGQCQRIAIAIALATSPGLVIADEPTTALDVTVQASILDLFSDVVADRGTGLLFVTHDIAVLARVAERAVVLALGRVVEEGSVSRLIATPAEPLTRRLVDAARATSWRPLEVRR